VLKKVEEAIANLEKSTSRENKNLDIIAYQLDVSAPSDLKETVQR
jgi:hypothetical protein